MAGLGMLRLLPELFWRMRRTMLLSLYGIVLSINLSVMYFCSVLFFPTGAHGGGSLSPLLVLGTGAGVVFVAGAAGRRLWAAGVAGRCW